MTVFNSLMFPSFLKGQKLNIPMSMRVAMMLATTSESNFYNAMCGMFVTDDSVYVEGLVAVSWMSGPMEHAWIEVPSSGQIVDPTPHFCEGQAGVLRYFPAQRWTRNDVKRLMVKHCDKVDLPLFLHHVQSVHGRRVTVAANVTHGWRRAIEDCYKLCAAFDCETGLSSAAHIEAEQAMLAHDLSAWPLPGGDDVEF